jgi:hypothetical protein
MKTLVRFTIALFVFGMLVACLTTGTTPAPVPTAVPAATKPAATSVPPSPGPSATPTSAVAATPAAAGAGAQVPSSCDAIASLVGAYMGGVATTRSLGRPQHLSCEFANSQATTIIIVNIGVGGTPAAFDALRATSAQGGRTVTPVSGLGVSAFSVSKNNVPAGVAVLTAQGLVYDVNSNLPIAQDEALIEQLMALS